MFENTEDIKSLYTQYNELVKELRKKEIDTLNSDEYLNGTKISKLKKDGLFKLIKNRIDIKLDPVKKDRKILHDKYKTLSGSLNDRSDTNYFSKEKIAVYTCIIGKYDQIVEPHVKPDNIDYYIITDLDIPSNSLWKKIDANKFEEIDGLSNVLKNRYFKMNPHKVFKDYKYSIYVDGNIEIFTDFTEHVNRMSEYGFSHFKHSLRKDSYQEGDACKLLRKESNENIDRYLDKIRKDNFPEGYGLLECSILVREHHKKECVSIMEQWWNEFKDNVHRDQIILPFILFKNNIKVDEVCTLGRNLDDDLSFDVKKHR